MNLSFGRRGETGSSGLERDSRLDQVRGYLSPLNLHIGAVAVLLLVTLYLVAHLLLVWSHRGSAGNEATATARTEALAADLQAKPLRGLDGKIAASREQADTFYTTRLPFGYADVAEELGVLSKRTGVRLSRVQYVQTTPANGLTELRMDLGLTGEYRPLALFLNGLERDRRFFLVQNVALSGQQGGVVSLRLRMTSYLREPMPSLQTAQATNGAQP